MTKILLAFMPTLAVVGLATYSVSRIPSVQAASAHPSLTGIIKDASGKPMGGVDVSARSTALPFTTTVFADENGEYVFPALAAGSYKIWAQAEGLAVERAEVELDDASTAIVIETQRDDRDFFSTLHPMFLTPALQQIHRPDRTATRRDGNIERLRKMLTKEDTYFGLRRVESYSFILLPVGYLAAECRTMPTPT